MRATSGWTARGLSMSEDRGSARLILESADPRTHYAVSNARLATVAQGSGPLTLDLAAGLYEVVRTLGPQREVELVRLREGEVSRVSSLAGTAPVLLPIKRLLAGELGGHAAMMERATTAWAWPR